MYVKVTTQVVISFGILLMNSSVHRFDQRHSNLLCLDISSLLYNNGTYCQMAIFLNYDDSGKEKIVEFHIVEFNDVRPTFIAK